jgi:hypothetical protein
VQVGRAYRELKELAELHCVHGKIWPAHEDHLNIPVPILGQQTQRNPVHATATEVHARD